MSERLTGIRWRALFGAVQAENYPHFELWAAHSDVVPDYRLDPMPGFPMFPNSGLSPQFAQNVQAGSTPVTLFAGPYAVQAQQLTPSGYMPFPALQQGFDYDGSSTLLIETLCSPQPGLGTPVNFQVPYRMAPFAWQPSVTVFASAGWSGQPSPLQPSTVTTGIGDAFLYDWELQFVRTASVATSPWTIVPWGTAPDYQTPIVASYAPPGTSIQIEYRGASSPTATPTSWSSTPDIADGLVLLQFRVSMQADAVTGAVPWVDTLIVPLQ